MLRRLKSAAALVALAAVVATHPSVATAAVFIFDSATNGNFSAPNSVAPIKFTVGAGTGNVTLETFNYHAGSGAFESAGAATGGFDPILTLFDSTGNFLTDFRQNIDTSGGNLDAQIVTNGVSNPTLDAGDYYVTLTQFDNTFSLGGNLFTNPTFLRQNQPNYTTTLNQGGLGCSFAFTDRNCTQRVNAWKVGIDGVVTASFVPLPGALLLLASGLAGLGVASWRQRRLLAAAPAKPS